MNVINSIKNKQIFFSTWLKRVYLIIHYHIVVSLSLDNDLIPYVRTYTCSISCSFVLRCVGEIRLKIPNFEITKKTSKLLLSSNKENFTRASESAYIIAIKMQAEIAGGKHARSSVFL